MASPKLAKDLKIFVGGFEITQFVNRWSINAEPDEIVRLNLELYVYGLEENVIHCGDMPTDEFMAEMVRLKLKREGIMDEKGCNDNKSS